MPWCATKVPDSGRRRHQLLGIIGRNGAGKSTLLKILSRVTTQSSGQIQVKGRIASLLEVGTGFHPELTGRENIFLNGAILGMRKAEPKRWGGAENRRPGKAEGRATEGWPEGCSIGDDANQRLPQAGPQGFADWESKNEIARKFDEIVEFSGCASAQKQLRVTSHGWRVKTNPAGGGL
jgi:ATPase subunit of ABC transporter with duplicated ATPase domains